MPIIINKKTSSGAAVDVNIKSAEINQNGQLVFVMDDNTRVSAGQVLSQEQGEALNNAITPSKLGDGLSVDNEGNLVITATVSAAGTTIPLTDGTFAIPVAKENGYGLVKLSNTVKTDSLGGLYVQKVDVSKLVNENNTDLVIGG